MTKIHSNFQALPYRLQVLFFIIMFCSNSIQRAASDFLY